MTSTQIAEFLKKEGKQEVIHAFFLLLKEKHVSFVELSKMYTYFLETEINENRTVVAELAYSLAMYKDPNKNMDNHEALRMKSNKAIIASRIFQGTPYEQELLMNAEIHYQPVETRGRKSKKSP